MIRAKCVIKTFGTFKALDDISLPAAKGEIRALLGENSAGKTRLMNVLYGLYKPDAGQICIAPIWTYMHGFGSSPSACASGSRS